MGDPPVSQVDHSNVITIVGNRTVLFTFERIIIPGILVTCYYAKIKIASREIDDVNTISYVLSVICFAYTARIESHVDLFSTTLEVVDMFLSRKCTQPSKGDVLNISPRVSSHVLVTYPCLRTVSYVRILTCVVTG